MQDILSRLRHAGGLSIAEIPQWRLNAELPEDSDIVWMVRCVVTYPEVETPAIYKSWNE